uniref:General secretion pathway protein E/type IV pilus assembly protein PilB n=1 Tax=Candidatus Kentrum sp. FM TaxID=2126340 RepID=A0A450W4B2_9GAMM|nr:MAG: general secretion pathway protein E/type IV pilus assembly protein PilB [Candidatus Kentron sp. FM]VFJ58654.1 MAG: general secretion pathway protein E/type IV pilus assembly protein PilB [Candidatus Kentron sp. FM]VFK11870.1 MAG: general secretion pathway protein E/type IV pilus assembly protein PilB [Candidatus Kentron sp. FM]
MTTTFSPRQPRHVGQILVAKGVISEDQLRIALIEQEKKKERISKIIVQLGFATDTVIRDVLAGVLGFDCVDFSRLLVDKQAVELIPKEMARRHHLLAVTLNRQKNIVTVAMADPNNVIAVDQIKALLDRDLGIEVLLAGETELAKAIEQFYDYELSIDGILQEIETGQIDYQSLEAASDEYSQPLVRLVNALLSDAVKQSASDIHFEPEQEFVRIRYRIDGVLRQIRSLHKNYWSAIAVRLKVMAGMNIAEARAPQDGHISVSVSGHSVDFRLSSFPTTHGENIVARILDRQKGLLPLENLGFSAESLDTLRLMMARPEGIVLVTGPTGSGKTTTLYSILNHLNTESVNIMTLEDPVEYPMNMIRQSSVNETVKLTFANGIRSLMRQDPDIILVGEIRDSDTARMAFRAAMTGHRVFSTVHTNSAAGILPRLLDIGISPEMMAGNIIGVIGQRLVRKLCVHCKRVTELADSERWLLGIAADSEIPPVYRALGCRHCDGYGYKGRLALVELLRFDAEIDELVARRANVPEINRIAAAKGFVSLADDGIRKVLRGVTSLEELSRVLDLTGRFSAMHH